MKRFAIVLSAALLGCGVSQAQNTIIAGKITDKKGMPIPNAIIQFTNGTAETQVKSDKLGLYHTIKLLPEGNYKVSATTKEGKSWKGGKLTLLDEKEKSYYVIKAKGKKLNVSRTQEDVISQAKMADAAAGQQNIDYPVKRYKDQPGLNTNNRLVTPANNKPVERVAPMQDR